MCRERPYRRLNYVPDCHCATTTRDTTQWCESCTRELAQLEREIDPTLPAEPTTHDILVAALAALNQA